MYLPVFGLGVLLAVHRNAVAALGTRLNSPTWAALALFAGLAWTSTWLVYRVGNSALTEALFPLSVLGATCTVPLAMHCRPVQDFLERRWVQWLAADPSAFS